MAAEDRRLDSVQVEELERLRVVTSRHLDLGTLRAKSFRATAGTRGRGPKPSCPPRPSRQRGEGRAVEGQCRGRPLDVTLMPEREAEQTPDLTAEIVMAGDVIVEESVNGGRREEAWALSVSVDRTSRANGASSPRSHAAAGIEKPRLRPRTTSAGSSGRAAARSSAFLRRSETRLLRGSDSAKSVTSVSRNGTRASSDHAIDARSVFTRRSSTSNTARSTSWRRANDSAPSVLACRVRRRSTGSNACSRPVSSARASRVKISFHAWCRSRAGRCAPRTNRFAL